MMSSIQLNHVAFTRNNFKGWLLVMKSTCSAFMQNNTLVVNNVSGEVYALSEMGSIKLNNMAFT